MILPHPSDDFCLHQPGLRNIEIKPYPHINNQGLGGSIWTSQVCLPFRSDVDIEPNEILYENVFALLAGVDAVKTQEIAEEAICQGRISESLIEVSFRIPTSAILRLIINRSEVDTTWQARGKVAASWGALTPGVPTEWILPGRSTGIVLTG